MNETKRVAIATGTQAEWIAEWIAETPRIATEVSR